MEYILKTEALTKQYNKRNAIMIAFMIFAMAVTIATKIFYGDQFVIGSFSSLFLLLGVQYLLHLGFACVIVLVCVLTRSSAFTMASGIYIRCHRCGLCLYRY